MKKILVALALIVLTYSSKAQQLNQKVIYVSYQCWGIYGTVTTIDNDSAKTVNNWLKNENFKSQNILMHYTEIFNGIETTNSYLFEFNEKGKYTIEKIK